MEAIHQDFNGDIFCFSHSHQNCYHHQALIIKWIVSQMKAETWNNFILKSSLINFMKFKTIQHWQHIIHSQNKVNWTYIDIAVLKSSWKTNQITPLIDVSFAHKEFLWGFSTFQTSVIWGVEGRLKLDLYVRLIRRVGGTHAAGFITMRTITLTRSTNILYNLQQVRTLHQICIKIWIWERKNEDWKECNRV